jgi:hypothetical protein
MLEDSWSAVVVDEPECRSSGLFADPAIRGDARSVREQRDGWLVKGGFV